MVARVYGGDGMNCEFCGNKSGRIDDRGNCISCGGPVNPIMDSPGGIIHMPGNPGPAFSWMTENIMIACDSVGNHPDMFGIRGRVTRFDDRFGGIVSIEE